MNKLAWLFGVATCLLGGICLYLLMQPRGSVGPASDAALQAELTQLRADRERLKTDVRSMRAAQAGPVYAPPPTAAATAPVSAGPAAPLLIRPEISLQSCRTMARIRHGVLIKRLGLTDAQVEALLDVLAAQEERALAAKPGDPLPNPEEVRARNRAELAAVVGAEAAGKLEASQQQYIVRMDLRRVRDQLEDMGEPLSAAQAARIEQLMLAHPPTPAPQRLANESNEAFFSRFKTWRQESREQIRANVTTVLEPRQLERYDELDEMARAFEKSMPGPFPMPPAAGRAAPPVR